MAGSSPARGCGRRVSLKRRSSDALVRLQEEERRREPAPGLEPAVDARGTPPGTRARARRPRGRSAAAPASSRTRSAKAGTEREGRLSTQNQPGVLEGPRDVGLARAGEARDDEEPRPVGARAAGRAARTPRSPGGAPGRRAATAHQLVHPLRRSAAPRRSRPRCSSWLRAATSTRSAMLRPGATGMRTSGTLDAQDQEASRPAGPAGRTPCPPPSARAAPPAPPAC